VDTLGETSGKTDWQVHAYCLMSNHFHLDRVLGEFGIPGDTSAGRQRFEEAMETRRFEAEAKTTRV
jgi:hypothetical protein